MSKSIKRALSLLLCAAMLFGAAPLNGFVGLHFPQFDLPKFSSLFSSVAHAEDNPTSGTCGENLTWEYDMSTATLTISGTGKMYDYYSEPEINVPWKSYCKGINHVVIDNGVTSIGNHAFFDCTSLTSAIISNSVTRIGYEVFYNTAFYNNTNNWYDNVLYINDYLIEASSGLSGICQIRLGTRVIADRAFFNCTGLTEVTIPDTVTDIGEMAFSCCSSLTSLIIPDNVTSIGERAFDGCYLKAIDVSKSNNYYHSYGNCLIETASKTLMKGCDNSTIPTDGSVTNIKDDAFWGCTGMTSIVIPDSVTSIGVGAFAACMGLKSIVIPDAVEIIGNSAFFSCTNLSDIVIPDGVTSIGDGAFSGTAYYNDNSNWQNNVLYINHHLIKAKATAISNAYEIKPDTKCIADDAFKGCTRMTSITIPNTVTDIGIAAFYGCTGLTSITIPESVSTIGEEAFCGCTRITTINYNALSVSDLPAASNVFGNAGKSGTGITVNIGNSVERIPNCLFYGNPYIPNVKSVVFGEHDTKIGRYAFGHCTELKILSLGNSVTNIGAYSFSGCTGLTSVTIPDSVTDIDNYAFRNCTGLTSMTIPDGVTSIGDRAFYECSGLKNLSIGKNVTKIGLGAFQRCTGLTSINYNAISANDLGDSLVFYAAGNKNAGVTVTFGDCVEKIPAHLFDVSTPSNRPNIKLVVIGNNVSSIGPCSFKGCSGLTSLTLPNSVTSIGDRAFFGCTGLTKLIIGDSVADFGKEAFYNCSGLTEIYYNSRNASDLNASSWAFYGAGKTGDGINIIFSDEVERIPAYLFYVRSSDARPSIKSVTVGNEVKSIGAYAFYGCKELSSVNIGKSVTSIEASAFSNCTNMTGVYITDLDKWCSIHFSNATSNPLCYAKKLYLNDALVTHVSIPNSISNINSFLFYNCISLSSVSIPDSVNEICESAFFGTGLTSITVPDNVTSIGDSAFSGCTMLTTINYNAANTSDLTYSSSVFYNAGNSGAGITVVFGDTVKRIPAYLFCVPSSSDRPNIQMVTVSDSVTSIGAYAFFGCKNLTRVDIGSSVTSMGDSAFSGCTMLTTINYNAANTSDLTSSSSVFYNAGKSGSGITVVFGDTVKRIPAYLFYVSSSSYRPNIQTLTIYDSVTSIGDSAFSGCSGLTSVTIPNSVTSIGDSAFSGCSGLTSVTIPNSVTSIGGYAFYNCTGLTTINYNAANTSDLTSSSSVFYNAGKSGSGITVVFGDTVKRIPAYLFYVSSSSYRPNIQMLTIYDSVTSIGDSAFSGCSGLTSVTIPNSVASIGDSAFSGCSGLTSVTIPNSVMSIGDSAFSGCSGLTSVTIPNSVMNIGDSAFSGCSGLTSVTIPNSVTNIGEYAFYRCTGLTSVTISNRVTNIGGHAYYGCTGLTSVTIPYGVTSIGGYAFYNCTGLTSVTIPDSVTSVGGYAYYNCTGLKEVYYSGGEEQWSAISFGTDNTQLKKATIHYNSEIVGDKEVRITEGPIKLNVNDTTLLVANYYINGALKAGEPITWSSEDSSVVEIINEGSGLDSYATIKAKKDGVVKITAEANGQKANCRIIVGKGAPLLSVECSDDLYVQYDQGKFTNEQFAIPIKIGNNSGEKIYEWTNQQLKNMTAKNVTVEVTLPDGLSYSKKSNDKKMIYLTGDLETNCSYDFTEKLYLYNMPMVEMTKEIVVKVKSSNAPEVEKRITVHISGTAVREIDNLNDDTIAQNDKPLVLSKSLTYYGDLKVNNSTGMLIINSPVNITGKLIISGSSVTVNSTLNCQSLEISGGSLRVNGSFNCENVVMTDGYLSVESDKAFFGTWDILAKNGTIAVIDGKMSTNGLALRVKGKGTILDKSGGVIQQTGGKLIVNHDYYAYSNRTSTFTGGELWIGGNFTHGEKNDNFQASGSHSTVFFGAKNHSIDFDKGAVGKCSFNNLYIDNSYNSNRNEKFEQMVKAEFRRTTANSINFVYAKNGDYLTPGMEWEKNIVTLSNQCSAIELRGDTTLTQRYSQDELIRLGKVVAWWTAVLSSPLIQTEFDKIHNTEATFTVNNYDDLTFVVQGQSYGTWGCYGTVSWYCDKLGVSKDNARIVGLTAGADVTRFKNQAAIYLANECADELLSLCKKQFKKYSIKLLKELDADDVVYLLTSLDPNANGMSISIKFAKLKKNAVAKSTLYSTASEICDINELSCNSLEYPMLISMPDATMQPKKAITNDSTQALELNDKLLTAIKKAFGLNANSEITASMAASITRLDLSNSSLIDISGIESFANLEVLNLRGNYISDLSPILNLPNLISLDASDNNISQVVSFSSLTKLKYLDLSDNRLSDFSNVDAILPIVYLDVSNNNLTSLVGLNKLSSLEHLDISFNEIGVKNLSEINGLKQIKELFATNCGLNSIDGLTTSGIVSLNLSNNSIVTISGKKMPALKYAFFSWNSLSDLSFLSESQNLITLAIENNNLNNASLLSLPELANLENIDLSSNNISDLSFLADSNNLKICRLNNLPLESIGSLQQKAKIEELYVSAANLTDKDLACISSLESLRILDASNNNFSSLGFVGNCKSLQEIDVSMCGFSAEQVSEAMINYGVSIVRESDYIAVSEIELLTQDIEIAPNQSADILYFVYPFAATTKKVLWKSSNESVAKVDNNGKVTAIAAGNATITAAVENTELSASCRVTVKATSCTLTYNANGGTGAPVNQTGNGSITLSTQIPTRDGYTFKGWATSASATSAQYNAGSSYNLNANVTLYAVWQKNETPVTYTLTYNANGGTGAPVNQTGNGSITLSTQKPNRDGYTFKGWATSASATSAQYNAGSSYNLTANVTLYAVWQKNETPPAQPRVKGVSVGDVTMNYKAKTTLKPQITADDSAKYTVSYSSSNTNVASVDANGSVTGAKKGSATITCTVTDSFGNTVTDTCKITVKYTVWQWIIIILLFGWIWY